MVKILLFLIISFAHLNIFAQEILKSKNDYSELKEWGVNGNVKTITKYIYDIDKLTDSTINNSSKDSVSWINKIIIHYNKFGNVDSVDQSYKRGSPVSFGHSVTSYFYSNSNKDRDSKTIENLDLLTSSRHWLTKYSYHEYFFLPKGDLFREEIVQLDSSYKILTKTNNYPQFPLPIESSIIHYFFDKNNHLERVIIKARESNSIKAELVSQHLMFDNFNNPTLSIKIFKRENYTEKTLTVCEYTYF